MAYETRKNRRFVAKKEREAKIRNIFKHIARWLILTSIIMFIIGIIVGVPETIFVILIPVILAVSFSGGLTTQDLLFMIWWDGGKE
ncbi:MAG: hypothetical protein ACOX6Y_04780 [Christensenellales bacterium]